MQNGFQRVISLEGGCNLRDLGGYPSSDGRRVRPGHLYRSGVLAYLTERDHTQLADLQVQVICDLRRTDERNNEPTLWPGATVLYWEDGDARELSEHAWTEAADSAQGRDLMINLYRTMPAWIESRLRGVFHSIAEGRVPLVFHCAAGKDRTGLTAALILDLLGVSREIIYEDYLLTNTAVDLPGFVRTYRRARMGLSDDKHPITRMNKGVAEAMLRADLDYLTAALEQIETQYGSTEGFLEECIGVDQAMRRSIRDSLLE